jgi:hypothetical protein
VDALRDFLISVVTNYPEIEEIGARRNIKPADLVLLGVRKFDRDFVPDDGSPEELLRIHPTGTLLNERDAHDLYRQLSRYFARKGIQKLSPEERKQYGKQGGLARWRKAKPAPEEPKEGNQQ